ncbi:hypothetical protein N9B31_08385 [Mariniblastus sp.]|jgi:hypothetical protein|nr:hypothetical protein [Mariniblastus sp.]MDA7906495.1 hypothetical protein [Mariniblastus sp.]MDA7924459.1 hypothetical protein [Mariniblastus sp.]MDA7929168.1 hypothetical protein [Mariniblastus sp.]MDB4564549.1 hypothetical protein [Mariniblastus sp.]
MRPILAILLSSLLMGGVYSYLSFSNSVRRPPLTIEITQAEGNYTLEIERTFRCVADTILEEPSLAVQFGKTQIYLREDEVPIEERIKIGPIEGIEEGENEFLITATMDEFFENLGVLKVTVFRDEIPLASKMFASESGLTSISGPLVFNSQEKESTSHQH